MADKRRDDDEQRKRMERMRQLLTPISEERAREIGDQYTKHMRDAVERTRQQQGNVDALESASTLPDSTVRGRPNET